ncbi:MAG: alpha/beta fold hydrolase [Spirochaetaceae bacterium]
MKRNDDSFETRDGTRLARTVWEPSGGDGAAVRLGVGDGAAVRFGVARGAVLIIHGMAEHRARYAAVAETLADRGFLVWAYDQRGHGDSAPTPQSRRHIAPGNNWTSLVEDARELLASLAHAFSRAGAGRGGPLFALGHSMGSLVLRDVLRHPPSPLCGAIMMGTAGPGGLRAAAGRALAAIIASFSPPDAPSKLLNDLTFGAYNAAVGDVQTEFDWLSRDSEEVRRYIDDPYCGEIMSAHFYRELARGMMRVSSPAAVGAIPHEISLLLLSGTEDPVGGHGRGVREVAERLERAGHPRVELRLRDGARHELLHEIDRREIIDEIAEWLERRTATCQNRPHQQE